MESIYPTHSFICKYWQNYVAPIIQKKAILATAGN
jgi:hypothetical protein